MNKYIHTINSFYDAKQTDFFSPTVALIRDNGTERVFIEDSNEIDKPLYLKGDTLETAYFSDSIENVRLAYIPDDVYEVPQAYGTGTTITKEVLDSDFNTHVVKIIAGTGKFAITAGTTTDMSWNVRDEEISKTKPVNSVNLQSTGAIDKCCIKIPLTGACQVVICALGTSTGRYLKLAFDNEIVCDELCKIATSKVITKGTYEHTENKAGTLSIFSGNSGIYVYSVHVFYE